MSQAHRATGLELHGITNVARVYWNLSVPALYEEAVRRREAIISADGPLVCRTGQHTGRSPNDKFIVDEPSSTDRVWWSKVNRPIAARNFDALHQRFLNYVEGRELFVQDCHAGADPVFNLAVPQSCPGVPPEVLKPRHTWKDTAAYDAQARKLAGMFTDNFQAFAADAAPDVKAAGPR